MLSQSFSRASLRNLSRRPPRVFPQASRHSFPCIHPSTFIPCRYESEFRRYPPPPPQRQPPRRHHLRYDVEEARRAKPLFTNEQISGAVRSPKLKWIAVIAVGSGTIFYFSNLETVPVSGRKRFNCYSDATLEAEGARAYRMILQEHARSILPEWDRRTKLVKKVMARLIPASGLEHVDWEVHVISSNEANAFVLPGGKVFVYSGILPITKNEDGLAAVLGHEIAHNLARHSAERMSSVILIQEPLRIALYFLDATGYTFGLGRFIGEVMMDLGVMRPASRKQESEADYIGLMMMAHSCYDPKEAVKVWERMEASQKEHAVPEWMSTHPSNSNRISQLTKWLPKAEVARSESNCAVTLGYAQDFQKAFGGQNWVDVFRG